LIHPDKNKHPKAADAFHGEHNLVKADLCLVVEQAYKTLLDSDKKKLYQRVMREARERVEYERKKSNKKRETQGIIIIACICSKECQNYQKTLWKKKSTRQVNDYLKKSKSVKLISSVWSNQTEKGS
jgi:hypothetical protein